MTKWHCQTYFNYLQLAHLNYPQIFNFNWPFCFTYFSCSDVEGQNPCTHANVHTCYHGYQIILHNYCILEITILTVNLISRWLCEYNRMVFEFMLKSHFCYHTILQLVSPCVCTTNEEHHGSVGTGSWPILPSVWFGWKCSWLPRWNWLNLT